MKTKILLSILAIGLIVSAFGQNTLELTFSAVNSTAYEQLDSIKVMNRTQGDSTKLIWPDTSLTYEITPGDLLLCIGYSTDHSVGVQEISQEKEQFQLFQNYPNPVIDQSTISMYIPEKGTVNVMVTDIQGRVLIATDWQLNKGNHSFRFTPGEGNLFFLTTRWNGISRSIKILMTEPNTGKICMLDYTGSGNSEPQLKESSLRVGFIQESGILDSPTTNETYTFEFATNIPCPGTPTVTYEGQVYNTIQVFSQCWLKENLNVGTMIQGDEEMTDNGIMEKYCYNNQPGYCNTYGGLYQWNEMMQYTIQHGVQGICPPGWHLPTHEENKVLEGAVDSLYGIGHPEWDQSETWRGFDAGANLKTTNYWLYFSGTDKFGLSVRPNGIRDVDGTFYFLGEAGGWCTSVETVSGAWSHGAAVWSYGEAGQWTDPKEIGDGVRCLRDY